MKTQDSVTEKCGKSQLILIETMDRHSTQELKQVDMYICFLPSDINAEGKFQLPWHAAAGGL